MKLKSIYTALAAISCLGLSSAHAASIDIVGPSSFQQGVDTTFDLDIFGNNLLEGLNSAGDLSFYTQGGGLTINFDPAILQVNQTSFDEFGTNNSATDIWDFQRTATFDNVNGVIDLFVARTGTSLTMPASQLLTSIRFDIIGAGDSVLDIASADVSIGGFAYTADVAPPDPTGPQTTISAFYCVDGIQTFDAANQPTCGHGAPDGEPSIFLNDGLISVAPQTVVPVPAAVWLFGSGLIGLVGIARRRNV